MKTDKIDNMLLKICQEFPGMSQSEVIAFYDETVAERLFVLSPHAIRARLNVLAEVGLLILDRTTVKRRVFCYITGDGYRIGEGQIVATAPYGEDRP